MSSINPINFPEKKTCYSRLRFELLHDVKEVIVDLWLIAKLQLDLVQI